MSFFRQAKHGLIENDRRTLDRRTSELTQFQLIWNQFDFRTHGKWFDLCLKNETQFFNQMKRSWTGAARQRGKKVLFFFIRFLPKNFPYLYHRSHLGRNEGFLASFSANFVLLPKKWAHALGFFVNHVFTYLRTRCLRSTWLSKKFSISSVKKFKTFENK